MKKIIFSGLAISKRQRITGIERVVRETLLRLDRLAAGSGIELEYVVNQGAPHGVIKPDELHYIKVKEVRPHRFLNKMWRLPRYIKQQKGIGVCLDASSLYSRHYVAKLPDIRPLVTKFDRFKFRFKFNHIFLPAVKHYSDYIVTDSVYQKNLIVKHLHKKPEQVKVIPLGWEHIRDFTADENIFTKYTAIKPGAYYYTIGSIAPHKNLKWVYEVAKRHPEQTFVVAGGKNVRLWGDDSAVYALPNIIYPGYVSDAENKALMTHCKAFIFASKFEGFGIPPLEAVACGAPICVARATCLPEIYGPYAHYFDPDDFTVDLDALLKEPVADGQALLAQYTWEQSAQAWWQLLAALARGEQP